MLYHDVRVMGYYLWSIDAAVIGTSTAAAWWVGSRSGWWTWDAVCQAMAVSTVTVVIAFAAIGGRLRAYHARRTERLGKELLTLSEVAVYATAAACLAAEVLTAGAPGRAYLAMLLVGTGSLLLSRSVMRAIIRGSRRRGQDYRVWLIVGNNARASRLSEEVLANPHFGIRIEEVVDLPSKSVRGAENPRPSPGESASALRPRVVGVEEIRSIVGSRVIDEVVITLPVRSFYDETQQILDLCREAGISVKLPPEAFERPGDKTEVAKVGATPMVTHFTGPSNQVQLLVKRAIDLVCAAAGLIFLLPLFGLIALAIKLTTRGPILFTHTRVGLHGRHFRMVKFRSMIHDAHLQRPQLESYNQTGGFAFKIEHDPRVTPIGRILRKFHLDELPQLWNVLVGDMSLVGPRPLPPEEAPGNEWWQRRRLSMPPGLTCFWQVRGDHRMPFHQWMRLDLAYIDRWSVWLDIKLIASTFPKLIRGKGW